MDSIVLTLSEKEKVGVAELKEMQGLSSEAVLRQGLRLYQIVTRAAHAGLTMGFYDASGERVEYPDMGSKLPPDGGN
jgi:hypothetical protein